MFSALKKEGDYFNTFLRDFSKLKQKLKIQELRKIGESAIQKICPNRPSQWKDSERFHHIFFFLPVNIFLANRIKQSVLRAIIFFFFSHENLYSFLYQINVTQNSLFFFFLVSGIISY